MYSKDETIELIYERAYNMDLEELCDELAKTKEDRFYVLLHTIQKYPNANVELIRELLANEVAQKKVEELNV